MKPIPYKQETGDIERLPCPGAPQGPARFQNHTLCGLFCLASLSIMFLRFIHVVASVRASFYGSIIFHCADALHFFNPPTC